MSAKFMPGPWIVTPDPDGIPGDCCIGTADSKIDEVAVCSRRDAFLIAAAPDMYAVLQELAECSQYWSEYDVPLGIHDRIAAALAKAVQK